jgi:hypothetical protein
MTLQRRIVGGILIASGLLPFIGVAVVVGSAYLMPSVFHSLLGLFMVAGMDAPDNWAVGVTRMARFLLVCGAVGALLSALGMWLLRRVA